MIRQVMHWSWVCDSCGYETFRLYHSEDEAREGLDVHLRECRKANVLETGS